MVVVAGDEKVTLVPEIERMEVPEANGPTTVMPADRFAELATVAMALPSVVLVTTFVLAAVR